MPDADRDPPMVIPGAAIILTGPWIEMVLRLLLGAMKSGQSNGLAHRESHVQLVRALNCALPAQMSANGHADVRESPNVHDEPEPKPTVSVEEAAAQMGISPRQVRRLAKRGLGMQDRMGRPWLLYQSAIDEHLEGRQL